MHEMSVKLAIAITVLVIYVLLICTLMHLTTRRTSSQEEQVVQHSDWADQLDWQGGILFMNCVLSINH